MLRGTCLSNQATINPIKPQRHFAFFLIIVPHKYALIENGYIVFTHCHFNTPIDRLEHALFLKYVMIWL